MISVYKNLASNPTIYISIPPPLYHKGHGIREDIINDVLPRLIPSISTDAGVQLVDVFNALGGVTLHKISDFILMGQDVVWPHDGCHPNDFGYFDIANVMSISIFSSYNPLKNILS